MVGRDRIDDGLSGITRGPLTRFYKPIVAAIDGWCVGHGIELAMACDIRIATDRAQFGMFEIRRGMQPADGGIVNMLNTCGVGPTLEMLLTGEAFDAHKAYNVNMVSRVVVPEKLIEEAELVIAQILRCDQKAIESAKETLFECIGRPYYDQLRVEAMWGYALCGGNAAFQKRREEFLRREDKGRVGTTQNPLQTL
jgi:enoyl-CoA hydratase/carnithine racemase